MLEDNLIDPILVKAVTALTNDLKVSRLFAARPRPRPSLQYIWGMWSAGVEIVGCLVVCLA